MKERLTGAIILVALMVLLVPELLTGPIRSAPQTAAVTGSAEGPPLRSYVINIADDAHPRAQPTPLAATPPVDAAAPERSPAAAESATSPPNGKRAPEHSTPSPGAGPAAPATTSPPSAGAGGSGAWVVQLGSFAKRANADRLARAVRAKGFKVSVSQESSGRRLYRVRVGPAHDRATASELATQLQAAGHGGAVVPR